MKSLANGNTSKCEVNPVGSNKYRVQCTPTVRGRHELTVTVKGYKMSKSSFPVFVSIPPTQLSKPVKTITGQTKAYDVAVNSAGETIVASDSLVVMDTNGKRVQSFYGKGSGFKFCGVACDRSSNCVYAVGGAGTALVMKFSPNLKLLQQSKFAGSTLHSHSGIVRVEDEVFVCDSLNNCIKVYTKELEYKRQFGSESDGSGKLKNIRGISSDGLKNLYVSDVDQFCIHVFSTGGQFLFSFGQGITIALSWPIGVFVSGQHVFVVDHESCCIVVYTTDGNCLTSFGHDTCSDEYLHGVCVDMDGYVYVCDTKNKRIQVF